MSVINQVLKDLDKRGASIHSGEATIRVVQGRSRRSAALLVTAGAAGMLVATISVWLLWQGRQPVPPFPVVATLPKPVPRPVQMQPLPQAVAAMPPVLLPVIEHIEPAPVVAASGAQIITLFGTHFSEHATVALIDGTGHVYARRKVVEQSPEQIKLKINLGNKPAFWLAEVQNADGNVSAKYVIEVKPHKAAASKPENRLLPAATAVPVLHTQNAQLAEGIHKQPTQMSVQQQAENEFRRSYELMRQGRNSEALAGFEAALKLDTSHEQARQTLVSLLLELKRNSDAERVLQEGLQNNPQQTAFALLLARMQVGRNQLPQALQTMEKSLPYAAKQADYQAFLAALLQRQNRHAEAITYFQNALKLNPQSGVWLMGLGISLRAEQRNSEAREAYNRALEVHNLSDELQAFVTQQLKEL